MNADSKYINALTIQSGNLSVNGRVFPNGECNHIDALPVYKRLFLDYNQIFHTNYSNFFWAFTDLLTEDLEYAVKRAAMMIAIPISELSEENVFILKVPSNIILETDFYNFSDEIYAYMFPESLCSLWHTIYNVRKAEKQIIFPYIDENMITKKYKLSEFV